MNAGLVVRSDHRQKLTPWTHERENIMRKRYQQGSLKKFDGKWIAQWWEDNHRRKRTLGCVSKMAKAQARGELDAILAPINSRGQAPSASAKWGEFVNHTYLPFYQRKWKRSTAMTNEERLGVHLVPVFSERTLGSFSRDELQTMLDEKAAYGLSYSVVAHLRWDLRQIFRMAVAEGYLLRNPAELLFVPRDAKRPEHTFMNREEVQKCFAALEQRERLIVKFAILAGMRPGEILGLKWGHVSETHAHIQQRVYRGQIDSPKSSHSIRKAALSARLIDDIHAWKEISLDPGEDAWVFPSETGKTPLGRDNVWRRRIGPNLKAVGLGWVDFHVMRRTHATLMNEIHDDPKLVADQLGHTVDVNQNVYTRASVARRKEAVDALEAALPVM
jgi:integrase